MTVSANESVVQVAIEDSGEGIAANQLGLVFDEFYQVTPADGGKRVGTGLGLAVSRRLADAMDGEIDVVSTLGGGSTFTLNLPIVPIS